MCKHAPIRISARLTAWLRSADRIIMLTVLIPTFCESATLLIMGHLSMTSGVVFIGFVVAGSATIMNLNAAWLLILGWVVVNILPDTISVSVIFPTLAAVMLIARASPVQGFAAATLCMLAESNSFMQSPQNLSLGSFVTIGGTFLICMTIGVIWKLSKQRTNLEHETRKREQVRERNETADLLHSSIVNDLVYIVFLTNPIESPNTTIGIATSDSYGEINRVAIKALGDARTIITHLQHAPSTDIQMKHHRTTSLHLAELIRTHEDHLLKAGFTGITILPEQPILSVPTTIADGMTEIIDEIYANIIKYAEPAAGYCVTITYTGKSLTLELADTPSRTSLTPLLSGGTGIQHCQRITDNLGGTIIIRDGAQWAMKVVLPLCLEQN